MFFFTVKTSSKKIWLRGAGLQAWTLDLTRTLPLRRQRVPWLGYTFKTLLKINNSKCMVSDPSVCIGTVPKYFNKFDDKITFNDYVGAKIMLYCLPQRIILLINVMRMQCTYLCGVLYVPLIVYYKEFDHQVIFKLWRTDLLALPILRILILRTPESRHWLGNSTEFRHILLWVHYNQVLYQVDGFCSACFRMCLWMFHCILNSEEIFVSAKAFYLDLLFYIDL